jgi:hypothetical protein
VSRSEREMVLGDISQALEGRDLVFFGTRGDDADGLADLPNFAASFSVVSTYSQRVGIDAYSLEQFSGHRVDLDAHDIDDEPRRGPADALRDALLDRLGSHCAVMTYRPSTFLSAICFARADKARYLGMFKDHQFAFEHKPWVESAVRLLGLPRVPWVYVSDREQARAAECIQRGPVVLRTSRSSGGTGVRRVDSGAELARAWPDEPEAFVSVAPFIDSATPVNVGGVVWDDGVTVHFASVQLIGIPALTSRQFGYCGNDFGAIRDLGDEVIRDLERSVGTVGEWMRGLGYRGAFGVDFLVKDGTPLFTEVNPRFQGSTHLSNLLSRSLGESCLFTDHLAALLHVPMPRRAPLVDRTRDLPAMSHFVAHWLAPSASGVDGYRLARAATALPGLSHSDVLLSPNVVCAPGATVGRFTMRRSITTTGLDVDPAVSRVVADLSTANEGTLTR